MADFDTSDRTKPLHAPAAPLSGDEIAEMRRIARELDTRATVEALTAENARLTNHNGALQARVDKLADLNDRVLCEGLELVAGQNILRAERDRLKAEVERLTAELREARAQHLADLGQAQQPECYAAGIDMDLLGKLCREEPDEATKREVAEMMDGLRARDDSPRSHPDYPALVEMARESSKDGD